jgi:hypothetical protein
MILSGFSIWVKLKVPDIWGKRSLSQVMLK